MKRSDTRLFDEERVISTTREIQSTVDTKNIKTKNKAPTKISRIEALTPEEISKMTGEELYEALRTVQKKVNKQYKQVLYTYGPTPATEQLKRVLPDGKVSTAKIRTLKSKKGEEKKYDYDVNKARHILNIAVKFLNYETSNLKGAKQYIDKLDTKYKGYKQMAIDERLEFWDIMDKVRELQYNEYNYLGSEEAIRAVYTEVRSRKDQNLTASELVDEGKTILELKADELAAIKAAEDKEEEIELNALYDSL